MNIYFIIINFANRTSEFTSIMDWGVPGWKGSSVLMVLFFLVITYCLNRKYS